MAVNQILAARGSEMMGGWQQVYKFPYETYYYSWTVPYSSN